MAIKPHHLILGIAAVLTVSPITSSAVEDIAFDTIRRMGMGGAGTTITYDDSALMINPAGLARIKGPSIKGPRIGADIGTEFLGAANKINNLNSANKDNLGVIDSLSGTEGSVRLHLSPILAMANTGFGLGGFFGSDFQFKINEIGSLRMQGFTDAVAAVGVAKPFSIFGAKIDAGISAKLISRSTIYDKINGNTVIRMSDNELAERINNGTINDVFSSYSAKGFGIDIGVISDITLLNTPTTIGGTIRNIGATLTGEQTLGTGNATHTKSVSTALPVMTVVGISMTPNAPYVGDILIAADYQMAPAKNVYNGLSLGVEKRFFHDTMHVRGGVHQGYLVGGIGVDLRVFHADMAYYARELGDLPGEFPDKMYAFQFGILF